MQLTYINMMYIMCMQVIFNYLLDNPTQSLRKTTIDLPMRRTAACHAESFQHDFNELRNAHEFCCF